MFVSQGVLAVYYLQIARPTVSVDVECLQVRTTACTWQCADVGCRLLDHIKPQGIDDGDDCNTCKDGDDDASIQSKVEDAVAQIVQETLSLESAPTADQSLWDVGLESVLIPELTTKLNKRFGTYLSPQAMIKPEADTIKYFAELVSQQSSSPDGAVKIPTRYVARISCV